MPTTIWKGYLTFGLVSFPVKLSRAAREQTAHFHLLHAADHSRIHQRLYCAAEDKPVPRDQAPDEELRQVAPRTATIMEILEFVSMDQVDPVYLDSSYYVAPGRGGERPYALLFEALRQERYYGLAQLAMHHREHIVILRPGTLLHDAPLFGNAGVMPPFARRAPLACAACCCTPCFTSTKCGRRTNAAPIASWYETRNWNWPVCSSVPESKSSGRRNTMTRIERACRG